MTGDRRSAARRPWAPSGHWLFFGLLAAAFVTALLLHGFAHDELGRSATAVPVAGAGAATSAVPGDGSVVYRGADGRLTSRGLPPRTVALTFDDGPDPRWTPQVLDVLRREHVPATFFDVGSRVAQHPELVRRELRDGHEVGMHTFTHADLSSIPGWRENLELSLGQLAMTGATGRAGVLLRPPYSSLPSAVSSRDLAAIRQATGAGYAVVLADRDSEDWRRPGWVAIVGNALPAGDTGAVVLLHDGGGDRAQTVQALPHLIDTLRARGYRFTTVTGGLGLPAQAGDTRVSTIAHLQGVGLLGALRVADALAALVNWVVLPLSALALLRCLLMLALAGRSKRLAYRRTGDGSYLPPVSVVVPAYNEAVGIEAAVRSLRASDYPQLEIVVVDDGSTDGTAQIAESLGLPDVVVVRQANAGKAAALNTGIAAARHDVVVLVDGDTVFETGTVRMLVQPLQDPAVGAVSGNTKVGNRHGLLGRWQHLEYIVGLNLDRRMYDLFGCITTVPGAIGAFRRSVLDEVGGIGTDTLAEDTDVTMAVNRAGYRVVYEDRAVAWTEAPSNLTDLWRQRYRWCYGTLQTVWKHRGAVLEVGGGRRLGWVGLPSLVLIGVLLPIMSPVIDLYALYGVLFLHPLNVAIVWGGFTALQTVTAGYALWLDGEPLGPLWAVPLQQVLYRQLLYLVVVQSVLSAATGVALRWHKLERVGVEPVGALTRR